MRTDLTNKSQFDTKINLFFLKKMKQTEVVDDEYIETKA